MHRRWKKKIIPNFGHVTPNITLLMCLIFSPLKWREPFLQGYHVEQSLPSLILQKARAFLKLLRILKRFRFILVWPSHQLHAIRRNTCEIKQ